MFTLIKRSFVVCFVVFVVAVVFTVDLKSQSDPDWDVLNTFGLPWKCQAVEPWTVYSSSDWNYHWSVSSAVGIAVDLNSTVRSDETGEDVRAPADGVAEVTNEFGYGTSVIIHTVGNCQNCSAQGWAIRVAHLQDAVVSSGQSIVKGQLIGHANNSVGGCTQNCSTGSHIHMELRWPGMDSRSDYQAETWQNDNNHYMFGYPLSAFRSASGVNLYSNNCGNGSYTTVLYEHADMTGRMYKLYGAGSFSIPAWFDNQASAVVSDAPQVILYDQATQQGPSLSLDGSNQSIARQLHIINYEGGGNVNDTVSSVKVLNQCIQSAGVQSASISGCATPTPILGATATPFPGSTPTPVATPTPSCQTSDTGVTLFEHEGQGTTGGKCHTYGEGSYGNLGNQGLGGNTSSLRNPNNGFMVRLYDQANFGGTTAVFDTSVNNLGVYGWGDKAQSMIVERHISTACSPNPNAPVLYVDVNYGSGCVSVTQDIADLSVYGMQNALDSLKFLGTSSGTKEVFLYHDKNYQNLCGSYWQDQSDLRSCAGVSESVRVQAFTAPTPIPTVVGDVYTGNIADEAYIDKSTTASMVDGSLTTTWYAGGKVNVGFSWPVPVDVHHIKVWDTPNDTPTNGHINSLAIHFSDGTLISHVDMISAGPRCADITFPVRNNITWVNVVLIDSSGNMGYREVEIYATTGTQYTNNTCANPRSLTPVAGSIIPPSSVAPVATPVPTVTSTPMPTATPALPQSGTYPVGANPQNVYVAFSSLWVANYNNNTITRLSLATGAVQATISTGSFPFDITSDGSYIYVTLYGSNAIAKIDPLSNTVVGSLPFPDSHPWLIEYDGTSLWITSYWNHARVVKMNPSSGSVLCSTSGTGVVNLGLRVDGSFIWTSDTYNNTLYKINTSNCSVALGPLAVGASPREITSDSTHVWVANYSSVTVSKIDKSSGSVVASYPAGSNPYAAAVLNGIVYITNWQAGSGTSVTARASSNGSLVNTYTVGTGPVGIVSDGVSLFVANSGSNTVSRIVP